MRRLDGASAMMIYSDVPRVYQHTLKIVVLDWSKTSSGYSYGEIFNAVRDRVDAIPMSKWKVARVPLGVNHPVWIRDLDFNISHHVRRIACPASGDQKAFCELVSELYAQPLDKHRPLWMAWIVEGLENDRVAVVTMFHHAYCDGLGASLLLESMFTSESFIGKEPSVHRVDEFSNPGRLRLFWYGLKDLPKLFVREIPISLRRIIRFKEAEKAYIAAGNSLPASTKNAPDSPFNKPFSHGRTFSFITFELADVRAVGKHLGATINEMHLSIITGAIRRFYHSRNLTPSESLIVSVPINIRTEQQKNEVIGNYVSSMYAHLPIHLDDPVERTRLIQESSKIMKEHNEVTGFASLAGVRELFPPAFYRILNWLVDRSDGRIKLFGNVISSCVKGPSRAIRMAGVEVVGWYSIGQVVAGIGLNLTAWSYVGNFTICLMADKNVVPDGGEFVGFLRESFEEYQVFCLN